MANAPAVAEAEAIASRDVLLASDGICWNCGQYNKQGLVYFACSECEVRWLRPSARCYLTLEYERRHLDELDNRLCQLQGIPTVDFTKPGFHNHP